MKLLHIDSSVLGSYSVSRLLSAEIVAEWRKAQPQASVEYLDHYRKFRTLDSYAARTLLNRESMKTSALAMIRELVKG